MKYNMYPILNKVIIKREEAAEMTKGGLHIPQSAIGKTHVGDVVAVGPDVTQVKVGDKVLFGAYSGENFKLGGIKYDVMVEKDIQFWMEEIEEESQEVDTDVIPMATI